MKQIIVIEEDAAMKMLMSEWLALAGYAVGSYPSIRHVRRPEPEVDLVIVDVSSERTQADMASGRLPQLFPRAVLMGMSGQLGHSLPDTSAPARAWGLRWLLAKPFAREELVGAVATALTRRR